MTDRLKRLRDRVGERRARLTAAGTWGMFVQLRDLLKRGGMKPTVANDVAETAVSPELPVPLSQDEAQLKVAAVGLLAGQEVGGEIWNTAVATGQLPPELDQGAGQDLGAVAKTWGVNEAEGNSDMDEQAEDAVELPALGKRAARLPRLAAGVDPAFGPLLEAAEGKASTQREEIRWVQANLLQALDRVDRAEIPSPGAVSLLEWARASAANRAEFMTKIYTKTVPTRAQVDTDSEDVDDDGRATKQLLDDFVKQLTAVLPSRAENAG